MEIIIKPKAFEWYKEELDLGEGDFVRFFPRYGGCGTVQTGFSLGVDKETPVDPKVVTTIDGITFFIEERDTWYFDERHLVVEFNEQAGEPVFHVQ
ncbi:HesB/YadR/YfhF family protein [Anoxybacteroides amylolyticum]|uniref:Iron-sulfur cluster biosynthesis family protein n=1 Tax=Anoxybacteroides amylolyticum TaxID=294699 RepID=A0A160F3Q1_9BACL|nr:HesB/YadR/YfhF family protein [Anoxybacillus amylolyticus]ANB60958.1 iron-sulfur cluster biosynthesis family protein [Anoxybacillus amylolyticus]